MDGAEKQSNEPTCTFIIMEKKEARKGRVHGHHYHLTKDIEKHRNTNMTQEYGFKKEHRAND